MNEIFHPLRDSCRSIGGCASEMNECFSEMKERLASISPWRLTCAALRAKWAIHLAQCAAPELHGRLTQRKEWL